MNGLRHQNWHHDLLSGLHGCSAFLLLIVIPQADQQFRPRLSCYHRDSAFRLLEMILQVGRQYRRHQSCFRVLRSVCYRPSSDSEQSLQVLQRDRLLGRLRLVFRHSHLGLVRLPRVRYMGSLIALGYRYVSQRLREQRWWVGPIESRQY